MNVCYVLHVADGSHVAATHLRSDKCSLCGRDDSVTVPNKRLLQFCYNNTHSERPQSVCGIDDSAHVTLLIC